jgi:hypothetical protein
MTKKHNFSAYSRRSTKVRKNAVSLHAKHKKKLKYYHKYNETEKIGCNTNNGK